MNSIKLDIKKHSENGFLIAIILICIIAAAILKSRAYVIGYTISGLYVLKYNFNVVFSAKKKWLIFLAGLSFIAVLFFIKHDSSLGRLLIYKISFNLFKDNLWTGVGLGNFATHYLNYQAAYFKQGNYSIKELLLADNTQHAFNDYWQFLIETGMVGLLFLTLAVVLLYSLIKKSFANSHKNIIIPITLLQFCSMLIAACLTHIFEFWYVQMLIVICLALLIFHAYLKNKITIFFFTTMSLAFIFYLQWGFYLLNYKSFKKLEEAKQLKSAGYLTEAIVEFRTLEPILKGNRVFLISYADILAAYDDYPKAEKVLLMLLQKQVNSNYYSNLADAYIKNGKFKNAESTYLAAINMVPNRFEPRFNLWKFYKKLNQTTKACAVANELVKLPVKIPSARIAIIKMTAKNNSCL